MMHVYLYFITMLYLLSFIYTLYITEFQSIEMPLCLISIMNPIGVPQCLSLKALIRNSTANIQQNSTLTTLHHGIYFVASK